MACQCLDKCQTYLCVHQIAAVAGPVSDLRDPQTDAQRVQVPKWCVSSSHPDNILMGCPPPPPPLLSCLLFACRIVLHAPSLPVSDIDIMLPFSFRFLCRY